MDVKDSKLLYEIDLNARLGTSQLGKRTGMSQENVHYRLKRLEDKKIITGYMTLLNFFKIGYSGYHVYARFQNVSKEDKSKILQELLEHNHIYWIGEFCGKFDISFGLMAKNIMHFNELFSEIQSKYTNQLKDHNIATLVEVIQFPRNYLLNKKAISHKEPRIGKFVDTMKLDKLNEQILSKLSNNARMSALQIAKLLNKPASTILNRIKELEKQDIIQGYSTQINCQEYDYQSHTLFLTTQNMTKEKRKRLIAYCNAHPNIVFYVEVVSKWNFEITYELKNQKELQTAMMELRTVFSDIITDMESLMIFNNYVKYNQYPLKINESD